jgi:hypothetical protein
MSKKRIPTSIKRLAQQLSATRAEAKKLGIFPGDRDLLDCSCCGLMEDVAMNGILLTCRQDSLGIDTGLRFEQVDSDGLRFRCPSCGSEVALEENGE